MYYFLRIMMLLIVFVMLFGLILIVINFRELNGKKLQLVGLQYLLIGLVGSMINFIALSEGVIVLAILFGLIISLLGLFAKN